MAKTRNSLRDRVEDGALRVLFWLARRVPYERRVPLMGWIAARVAPLVGWTRRIEENLALVRPDLTADEVARLKRAVPDNLGRTLIETYSPAEFAARVRDTPLDGPGVAPLREARAEGRRVVFVTGHIGNFLAARAALHAHGFPLAGLYRPMHNPNFNAHYVEALSAIGGPVFPTTRPGILAYLRHLHEGGIVGILIDVYTDRGAPLTFFGKVAPTALSAAEWAVQHDALVVPVYGLRRPDGLTFEVYLDTPVPLGDPAEMTQTLNDGIERMARAHMGQYLWVHRRWKERYERRRRRHAARSAAADGDG